MLLDYPPKYLLLRTATSQKSPPKNPGMGQGCIALLFCIAMPLVSMGSRLWKSFRGTDRGLNHSAGHYLLTLVTSCVGIQRGEEHYSCKTILDHNTSIYGCKMRLYFFEVNKGGFFCGLILVFSHRCCPPVLFLTATALDKLNLGTNVAYGT